MLGSAAWSAERDDAALLARHRGGDPEAFAELYRRHVQSVRAVCCGRLRDHDLVEEAVQETFVRALGGLRSFDGPSMDGWLRTVAINHCIDIARRKGLAATAHPDAVAGVPDRSAEREFDRVADRALVYRVFRRLRQRDRDLLIAHHVEGVPLDQLADRANMTTGAMAVALHRARSRARLHGRRELLGGMAPLGPWLRQKRIALERFCSTFELPGAATLQMTAAHALIAVAIVAQSVLAGSLAGTERIAAAAPLTATSAPSMAGSQGAASSASASDRRDEAQVHEVGSSVNGVPAEAEPEPVVRFEPVEVPGTSVRIHQQPEGEPTVTYRVGADAGGERVDVRVEVREREDSAVDSAVDPTVACDAAQLGRPVTDCDR